MNSDQLQQAREKAQTIVQRLESDEAFGKQLHDDPEGTLRAEGLPDEAIADFTQELGVSDVSGYMACIVTCIVTHHGGPATARHPCLRTPPPY